MGTLKTTNIQTITGSGTLTLGTSGETVNVPSGVTIDLSNATQTGVGPSGISSSSTSGTALSIDSSNRVTTSSNPGFLARSMAGSTFDSGTLTGGSLQYNTGSHYNSSNGTFTCPIAGRYFAYAAVLVQTGTGRLEGKIVKNGSQMVAFNGTGTTYDGPVAVCVLNCAANDTIKVQRVLGDAHNGGHNNIYFGVHFLG